MFIFIRESFWVFFFPKYFKIFIQLQTLKSPCSRIDFVNQVWQ